MAPVKVLAGAQHVSIRGSSASRARPKPWPARALVRSFFRALPDGTCSMKLDRSAGRKCPVALHLLQHSPLSEGAVERPGAGEVGRQRGREASLVAQIRWPSGIPRSAGDGRAGS